MTTLFGLLVLHIGGTYTEVPFYPNIESCRAAQHLLLQKDTKIYTVCVPHHLLVGNYKKVSPRQTNHVH